MIQGKIWMRILDSCIYMTGSLKT